MKWYSHPTYKFHLKEIDSGKLIINNKTYIINTDVSHKVQEATINSIIDSYPNCEWEWHDEINFKDVI